MGIEIEITDSAFSGDSKTLKKVRIARSEEAIRIALKGVDVSDKAILMENLEIGTVFSELKDRIKTLDSNSEEYREIKKLLSESEKSETFFDKVGSHIKKFAGGLLENVVAGLLIEKI